MANSVAELEIAVSEVVDYMKIAGSFSPALRAVVARKVTAEAARKAGISVSLKELQRAADVFRAANGLHSAKDTQKWLEGLALPLESLEGLLETNLLVNKFKDRLEKKASKTRYHSQPPIKESVREMVYLDWLSNSIS